MEESSLLLALVGVVLLCLQLKANGQVLTRHSVLNTGIISLVLGLATGAVTAGWFRVLQRPVPLHFDFDLYMVCLPVFIYQQGLGTKAHQLLNNMASILTLGVLGTVVSSVVISFVAYNFLTWIDIGLSPNQLFKQSVALGVILSSTDSVAALTAIESGTSPRGQNGHQSQPNQPNHHSPMFYLVFGESIVNDATAICLLRSVHQLAVTPGDAISFGVALIDLSLSFAWTLTASVAVGIGVGLLSAYLMRRFFGTHSTEREIALLFSLGLLSFTLAEHLGLSGVMSIFICGVVQSHYTYYSMSASARVVSLYASRVASVVAEILLFLGTSLSLFGEWDTIDYTKGKMMRKVAVVAPFLFVLVVVARFVSIWPMLSALGIRDRADIFLAGSVRGAVTLALAVYYFLGGNPYLKHHEIILCASSTLVVIASTIGMGTAVAYFLARKQRISVSDEDKSGSEDAREAGYAVLPLPADGSEAARAVAGQAVGQASIKRRWVEFDQRVMQPVFGGKRAGVQVPDEPGGPAPSPFQGDILAPLFSITDSLSVQRAELQIDATLLRGDSLNE